MPRNWREFGEGPRKASPDEITASMNSSSEITLNRFTFDQMGRPEAVVLLFEPETASIGVRPAAPQTRNAYRVTSKGRGGRYRVACASAFAREHDIRIDGTVRFPAAKIEDRVLVLDLRSRQTVIAPTRKAARRR